MQRFNIFTFLRNTLNLHQFLQNVENDCQDRCFNAFDLPIMQISSIQNVLISQALSDADEESVTHVKQLMRNLQSFGLTIEPVVGDGDCAFTSI